MHYLNREIEALTKRKNTQALAKRQHSCGIFQEINDISVSEKNKNEEGFDPTP